jgi:glycosyltransferase involved in cell wall biosynthesis
MKVGIYNEPSGTIGGSEYVVAVAADALAPRHRVEIVHHNPALTVEQLRHLAALDLDGVRLRYVEREPRPNPQDPSGLRYLPQRYTAEREWHATLSRPYDVFINSTHGVPPFCHASLGVLLVLFPMQERGTLWPWSQDVANGLTLKSLVRRVCANGVWRQRFASYAHRFAISEYTQRWVRAWWGIDAKVLYPPVDTTFEHPPKKNVVLSVGRFTTGIPSKRQIEMMALFQQLKHGVLREWCCYSVGGLAGGAEDHAYFGEVASLAKACGAHVIANVPRTQLRSLYQQACIFWHAAGYGGNQSRNPFEAEHFGIATVEAMAAGAVPVVFDQGGQTEIVEHGRSGFLWRSLDELREHTVALASDAALLERMSAAARIRAARFGVATFVRAITEIVR